MTPVEILLEKLPGVTKSGTGWSAHCPAHEDRKASLSVSEGEDGRALVRCHAGCTIEAIVKEIGLTLKDLFPPNESFTPPQPKPKPSGKTFDTAEAAVQELERHKGKRSAQWTYHDAHGEPIGVVVRWDTPNGKQIRPVFRHSDGWRIIAMPDPRPLYGLPILAEAKRVLVVEGEKAAEAARTLGFTATTSAGGSAAAPKTDWQPLAGKEVWILPDNDTPGRKFADTVAGILTKWGGVVKIIHLPGLPEKGDIVDWIDAHGDSAEPDAMRAEIEALAGAVEAEGISDDVIAFKPFPVEALPDPLRDFVVESAKAIGCDPSYLALPLLASLAAAIGNTRRLELKRGWSVPPIIWAAVVGESGTAKTPAFTLAMRPIRERQRKAMESHAEAMKKHEAELTLWEKDFAQWKRPKSTAEDPPVKPEMPPCVRFVVSDTTVEALAPILQANPRGLLLARDELNGWFGSFDRYAGRGKASADSATWLSMYNADNIIVDRKTGSPKTISIPQAAMCICGGIQPGILQRSLGDEHRESGLAARFLLTCPPRKPKQWTDADIDPLWETSLGHLFDRLFTRQPVKTENGESRYVLVRLTPEAKTAWTTYYNAHAKEQADLTGDLSAAYSKLEEYPARLALVIHYVRWAAFEVEDEFQLDLTSIQSGITLANWFKAEARRVYAMLGETETDRDLRKLVDWIGYKGGSVTVREVQQGCRWLKEPGAAEKALEELKSLGQGTWQEPSIPSAGGRPSRVFVMKQADRSTKPPTDIAI